MKNRGLLDDLFDGLLSQIEAAGYVARCGQIVDAAIMETARQRNPREGNERIKKGEVPEDWSDNQRRQKDSQARWTRIAGKTYFGYENHINVDVKHKVIRRFTRAFTWKQCATSV